MIRSRSSISLKFKILSPLLVMFGGFTLLSVAFIVTLGLRYHSLREQLNDVSSVHQKTSQIARLSARTQECLLEFRIANDRKHLSEIVELNVQRAALIDQVFAASVNSADRLQYVRAYVRSLDRLRTLQSTLLRSLESAGGSTLNNASREWRTLEAMSGARLMDLVNYLSNETEIAQNTLEEFLSIVFLATIGVLSLCAIGIWILALFYQRTVINPLASLRKGLRTVLSGNLSTEIEVPSSRDEIGEMCGDFNRMTSALRESQAELRAFVSIAAHDLRSPLATIRSFCDVLEEDVDEGNYVEARTNISRVASISARALELMDQILSFERAGQAKLELKKLDLRDVVGEALENLGATLRAAGAVVECGVLPQVRGDATQLRALFQNLLGNAVKFRRENTTPFVRVECREAVDEAGRWHEIRVIDNGRGFGPEVGDTMFKPFSRFKSSTGTEGFGVGLSTCRKIVCRHDGTITAEGRPGEGATFTIRLPH